jgi:hypothetical protein
MPEGYLRDGRFALAHIARGDAREADAMLVRLRALAQKPDFDPGVALAIAEIHAARNEPDRAFEWLERARATAKREHDPMPSWVLHENLQVAPYFKSLHADPRWDALLVATDVAP